MNVQATIQILWQFVVIIESSVVKVELSWAGFIVSGFVQLTIMAAIGAVVFYEVFREVYFALNYFGENWKVSCLKSNDESGYRKCLTALFI